MLPTVLSDALCSLTEHDLRFALCLNLVIVGGEIESSEFKNCVIKVIKIIGMILKSKKRMCRL